MSTKDWLILIGLVLLIWVGSGGSPFVAYNIYTPKIAFQCYLSDCDWGNDGEGEQNMISFLQTEGFTVTAKVYDSWSLDELLNYDVVFAFNPSRFNQAVADAHELHSIAIVETGQQNSPEYGSHFKYLYGTINEENEPCPDKIVVQDKLPMNWDWSGVIEICQSGATCECGYHDYRSMGKVAFNKEGIANRVLELAVDKSGTRGRYVNLVWMNDYRFNTVDLNENGKELIKRSINWAVCGSDSCIIVPPHPLGGAAEAFQNLFQNTWNYIQDLFRW